jgi:ABC-2 type transport system permease protein
MTTTERAQRRAGRASVTKGRPRAAPRRRPKKPDIDDRILKVLSSGPRPPQANALSASLTYGWRAMLKIKHVPEQLFDVTIFPILMTLMFTYLFGNAIAGSTSDYLHFLLPGILVMNVVFTTIYTGVTLNTDIEKGVFDRFRSLPVWQPSRLVGALLGDTARYTIGAAVVLALGLALGFRPDGGVLGVLGGVALLLVFAFSVGWVFTTLGLIMRTPNAVMSASMMVLFPLTFVSNVFVGAETLPSWLESFVNVNPITLVVTAVRGLMHGTATGGDIGVVLVVAVAFTAVFAPLTMRLYRHKQ